MKHPSCFLLSVLLVWMLFGCQQKISSTAFPTSRPENVVSTFQQTVLASHANLYQQQDCWFDLPTGVKVTCGYLLIPEDRSKPMTDKNTIRLAVAIFHSISKTPAPDPIVYQVGGPGGHMLSIVPTLYEKVIVPFLQTRDLILFDPRGTGYSQPALECKEDEDPGTCIRRLFAEGHNLYAYNSSSMAADLQDLRKSLGYDQWNLIGESYGSHVGQIVMVEHPERLRSVILDAVVPVVIPELPGGMGEFDLSLSRLFQECESNPHCRTAYPDLEGSLKRTVQRLNQNPISLMVEINGERHPVLLTGDRMVEGLRTGLYELSMIPFIPYAITLAEEGNYEFWEAAARWEIATNHLVTWGAHWSVACGDGRLGDECEDWPLVIHRMPVMSDIPVLILNGQFDPVTPPEYGYAVAETLSHHYVFDFPGFGHWVNGTGHPCQAGIIQAFLTSPFNQPDASCIADIGAPEFIIK